MTERVRYRVVKLCFVDNVRHRPGSANRPAYYFGPPGLVNDGLVADPEKTSVPAVAATTVPIAAPRPEVKSKPAAAG